MRKAHNGNLVVSKDTTNVVPLLSVPAEHDDTRSTLESSTPKPTTAAKVDKSSREAMCLYDSPAAYSQGALSCVIFSENHLHFFADHQEPSPLARLHYLLLWQSAWSTFR